MPATKETEKCWVLNEAAGEAMRLTRERFSELMTVGELQASSTAFSLALPAGLPLEHVGYQWAQTRFERFLYWERVVVAQAFRRRGVGRTLFETVSLSAYKRDLETLVCAVHDRPANAAGHAFVQALGFTAIESVMLPSRDIVTFYQRSTAIATP